MIALYNVSYEVSSGLATTPVLAGASIALPTNARLIVLGRDGSGKTSLIRLLAGQILPTVGTVTRDVRVSFPAGYLGGFKRHLSVRENIAHAARLYGADIKAVSDFIAELAELPDLSVAFEDFPQQSRVRIGYALTYAIPFDAYLADNLVAGGDVPFRERCEAVFDQRMQGSGCILTTRLPRYAKRFGNIGAILDRARLTLFEDLDEAIWRFERLDAE